MKRLLPFAVLGIALFLAGGFPAPVVPAQVVGPKDLEELAKKFTQTTEMISMRDGVKLNTIVYTPKEQKGPLPFVMMRTPYGIETRGPKALKEYWKDLA